LAWQNQGDKDADLTSVIKSTFELSLRANIGLPLSHVPSKENWADAPSRVLSVADCMLADQKAWQDLQTRWGPDTVDFMSLDSNMHIMVLTACYYVISPLGRRQTLLGLICSHSPL
jgi:hypothetical protein